MITLDFLKCEFILFLPLRFAVQGVNYFSAMNGAILDVGDVPVRATGKPPASGIFTIDKIKQFSVKRSGVFSYLKRSRSS